MRATLLITVGAVCATACGSSRPAATTPMPALPATSAGTSPTDIMVRTRVGVGDSFSPQRGEAALRAFVPEVALDQTGGECQSIRTEGSGATVVSAYYPKRVGVQTQVTVTFDSAGHVARYSERRGVPAPIKGVPTAKLDSALRASEAAVRSTTISFDYAIDQAIVMNHGGGKPTDAVIGAVRTMESVAKLGPPKETLERMRKLCGV